ncbi:MAG: alpha/beta hydrolase family protein [Armatimonadota bacterium]
MIKEIVSFTSKFDNSTRQAVLLASSDAGDTPLPLIIVPHAAGYSAADTAAYWRDLPARRGVIAVFPFGHGRKLETYSLGWRGQIDDLAQMPDVVSDYGLKVDTRRIFAAGISMGGQESLLLAGTHPDMVSGIVVFNAVADMAQLYSDSSVLCAVIADEVGGTPDESLDEYAARSPINYYATISRVPTLLYWDPNDDMVPGQDDRQCGALYDKIKTADPDAPIWVQKHKYGHFWINPGQAIKWLLDNYRKRD